MATLLAIVGMPQAASASPGWQQYTATSKWHCGDYYVVDQIAVFQACVVVNGNATQAVITVRNNTSTTIQIGLPSFNLYGAGSSVYMEHCNDSWLSPGANAACFGATVSRACGTYVQARGTVYARYPEGRWGYISNAWSVSTKMCT
ncbi:hypothetical protein ACFW0V_29235 [Micromonospora parva]